MCSCVHLSDSFWNTFYVIGTILGGWQYGDEQAHFLLLLNLNSSSSDRCYQVQLLKRIKNNLSIKNWKGNAGD